MRESSIVVHKGGKEEKYKLYIEDYVLSFLKEEAGTLELSDICFYGTREDEPRKYTVYGALRDKNSGYFENYSLLDEIGCRLTQAGPIFFIREKEGMYEIKGYEVFYQDNKEMQNYLIDRRKTADGEQERVLSERPAKKPEARNMHAQKASAGRVQHSAVSLQLGAILIVLVAIVINSANGYDKMRQLNQSAAEVLFAVENREAEDGTDTDGAEENPAGAEDPLKLAELENRESYAAGDDEETEDTAEEKTAESAAAPETEEGELADIPAADEAGAQDTEEKSAENDELEALSRNVARYYEVERGDTLYAISQKIYGDTTYVQEICELNEITDPDKICYGQKIVLP